MSDNMLEWIAYFSGLLIVTPIWLRLVCQELMDRGTVKVNKVGGIQFIKVGRFGGSWYVSRR